MKDLIKPVSIGLLLLFLAAMDWFKITDPELKGAALGLIATMMGWHALTNNPYVRNNQPPADPPARVPPTLGPLQ